MEKIIDFFSANAISLIAFVWSAAALFGISGLRTRIKKLEKLDAGK